jgi:hypothetical protein
VKPQPGPSGPVYPARTTPQNTVTYYKTAWENRDSTRIDSVLAVDYQGTSIDIGPTTETLSFVKSDEIRAAYGMANDLELSLVEVNLGSSGSWNRTSYASDPPDWAVIIIPHSQIILRFVNGDEIVVSPYRDSNEFRLKPVATTPDTTWQIVRWTETHNSP